MLDESTEEEVENNRKEEEGGNKEEERMSDELMMNDSEDGNVDDSVGITNATKQILTSICSVLSLFFNDNYKNDYHVSLEKVMELKKFEHEEKAVSLYFWGKKCMPLGHFLDNLLGLLYLP